MLMPAWDNSWEGAALPVQGRPGRSRALMPWSALCLGAQDAGTAAQNLAQQLEERQCWCPISEAFSGTCVSFVSICTNSPAKKQRQEVFGPFSRDHPVAFRFHLNLHLAGDLPSPPCSLQSTWEPLGQGDATSWPVAGDMFSTSEQVLICTGVGVSILLLLVAEQWVLWSGATGGPRLPAGGPCCRTFICKLQLFLLFDLF